ncbi:MAG: hypothetical protein OXI66_04345, partial [Boseongicola sp.]|nr:hypothetical protein [Boseongicola sp.]
CRTALSRSSTIGRWTLGDLIGPGIMQAADELTTDGRKMPGGGRDVDLPGNRRQGLGRNLNGFDPAAPGMTAAPLAAGAGTFFARFGPCGRSCTGFGA